MRCDRPVGCTFVSLLSKPSAFLLATAGAAASSVERAVLTTALRLPEPLQRRLAGPPVRIDGQALPPAPQLMLRLARIAGPAVESLPIERGRTVLLRQTQMAGGSQRIGRV